MSLARIVAVLALFSISIVLINAPRVIAQGETVRLYGICRYVGGHWDCVIEKPPAMIPAMTCSNPTKDVSDCTHIDGKKLKCPGGPLTAAGGFRSVGITCVISPY